MAGGFLGFPARHFIESTNHRTTTDPMNKTEIIALLLAAGIACDETMTVAALKELAAANNVSLVKEKPVLPEVPEEEEPELSIDDLVAAKVAAGLTFEQALEVIKRQAEADALAK